MGLEDVLLALHLLAAVLWVGGMAFAHVVLRPAALALAGPERLRLWRGVLARFLPIAGGSALVLLASGHLLIPALYRTLAATPRFVHAMLAIGWVMAAVYLLVVLGPWRRFRAAVDAGNGRRGGRPPRPGAKARQPQSAARPFRRPARRLAPGVRPG